MKIDILDAHDRYQQFNKQSDYISKGCADCIQYRPKEFEDYPFYIFAHARTEEDGVTKRLIWQPRLTKPKAQSNSMLFKAYPPSDVIKIIWMIPAQELWATYEKGKLTESKHIYESIYAFQYDRKKLESREVDDLHDYQVRDIYEQMRLNAAYKDEIAKLNSLEVPSVSLEKPIQNPLLLFDDQF